MLRAGLGLAAVALAGCAQILGLDAPEAAGTGSGSGSGSPDGGGFGSGVGSGSGSGCSGAVFNSLCYELVSSGAPFGPAIDICRNHSGKLAKVDSAMLEAVLADRIPLSTEVFLGATDQAQPGTFRWLDGSALTFTAWLPSEPDISATEHCLAIQNAGQIGWKVAPCSDVLQFFCVYPL